MRMLQAATIAIHHTSIAATKSGRKKKTQKLLAVWRSVDDKTSISCPTISLSYSAMYYSSTKRKKHKQIPLFQEILVKEWSECQAQKFILQMLTHDTQS